MKYLTKPGVDKIKYIRYAAIIAIVGNAVLALLKIVAGVATGSNALVGAGIDSSTDVLIGTMTLVIVGIMSKPADAKHPWGHGRVETVATTILSFIIFFAGAQLIISAVTDIFTGEPHFMPSIFALVVTVVSIVGKLLLAWCQHILGKRADSAMVKANAKNMAGDVLTSVGVLVGLIVSAITGSRVADSVIAILIGLWIIKAAIEIFLEANLELMDGNSDMEKYGVVVAAVNAVEGACNPHKIRMRSIGGFWDIDLDIEVNPELTVQEAHEIALKVENEIKRRLENVFDIMIHIEPQGDRTHEAFGLCGDEIRRQKNFE